MNLITFNSVLKRLSLLIISASLLFSLSNLQAFSSTESSSSIYKAKVFSTLAINPGDYVEFTYYPSKQQLDWKGQVTLLNGCQFLESAKLNYIYYFLPPLPTDPSYSFDLNISDSGQAACTQILKYHQFSGSEKSVFFSDEQLQNFKKQFTLNYSYPYNKQWWNGLNFAKLNWIEKDSKNYKTRLRNLNIIGSVLQPKESDKDCTGVRYGLIGRYCKQVKMDLKDEKTGIVTTSIIKNVYGLKGNLGSVTTFNKLHFVADALRGNGWDKGETIYKGKNLLRVQNECSTEVTYYELINRKNDYKIVTLKTENSDFPAICE